MSRLTPTKECGFQEFANSIVAELARSGSDQRLHVPSHVVFPHYREPQPLVESASRIDLQHVEPHRQPAGRGRRLNLAHERGPNAMPLMLRHEGDVVHEDVVVMILDPEASDRLAA